MTFRVFQFWNGAQATIRDVEVPQDVVDDINNKRDTRSNDSMRTDLLNAIYHHGQNEIQNLNAPSVSVGDIIELSFQGEYEFWVVANVGFENYGREKHFYFTQSRPGNDIIGADKRT